MARKWIEKLHPRGKGGKFTFKGGGSSSGGSKAPKQKLRKDQGYFATAAKAQATAAKYKADSKKSKEYKKTHKVALTEQGRRVVKGGTIGGGAVPLVGGIAGGAIAQRTGKNRGKEWNQVVKKKYRSEGAAKRALNRNANDRNRLGGASAKKRERIERNIRIRKSKVDATRAARKATLAGKPKTKRVLNVGKNRKKGMGATRNIKRR